jgi:DNA replication protein DnaC
MLTHPTLEKLRAMKLWGMAKALEEQMASPEINSLSFEERLGLMVDREMDERLNRRMATRLKKAKLRLPACMEDIDYRHQRGLDKALMLSLASCSFVRKSQNIIITGPTGVGKTYLACALTHKACLEGYSAQYLRLPKLLSELAVARGDGRYPKIMTAYAKVDLLVLDDWGIDRLSREERLDILELLEDRYGLKSTLVVGQVPIEQWHEIIGDPTLADAILDRLVHNAHKIELKGDSLRKEYGGLT